MPHVTVTMELPSRQIASLRTQLDRTDKNVAVRGLMNVMRGMLSPEYANRGYLRACIASDCATATVTCAYASAVDNTDTVTIGGTALTARTSATLTSEFTIGASNSAMATNLAAAINANATLQKIVRATASGAVVTITSVYPGPIGNLITLAESGNGMTISGAALASGASDEVDGYAFGYTPTT